jgi:hypothetical protein
MQVVNQERDAGSAVCGAEPDVVQPAVAAQGDGAASVDGVVVDSIVRRDLTPVGTAFGLVA